MKFAILACLSVCFAAALASPVNYVSVGSSIASAPGQQDVLIDVTSDFTDTLNDQHIFQVAVRVEVQEGVAMINGQRVAQGVQTTLQFAASFRVIAHGTGKVLSARNVQVGVQAVVQATVTDGSLSALSVQMLLSEVDGSRLTQVAVREVIVFVNPQGNEQSRQVHTVPLTQTQLTTAAPVASSTSGADTTGDSPSASEGDSTSDSPDHGESDVKHSSHHNCRVHRFFSWLRKQSAAVRILVFAAMTFFALVLLKITFCCMRMCCCPAKTRTTYLDNVKLHYVPLAMDEPEKKPLLI